MSKVKLDETFPKKESLTYQHVAGIILITNCVSEINQNFHSFDPSKILISDHLKAKLSKELVQALRVNICSESEWINIWFSELLVVDD